MSWVTQVAYQAAENVLRLIDVSPPWSQQQSDTFLDLTNISANTTAYGYFNLYGYKFFSIDAETSGTAPTDVLTCTIEFATESGSDHTALNYTDWTREFWGVDSWVDTDFSIIAQLPMPFTWGRIKYVTSNTGGNDCDLTAHIKRIY